MLKILYHWRRNSYGVGSKLDLEYHVRFWSCLLLNQVRAHSCVDQIDAYS